MSDDITIDVDGKTFGGWTDVRVTRGIERCPSDFTIGLTERYPDQKDFLVIKPGSACTVRAGADTVLTGYIDRVGIDVSPTGHNLTISGRSKCADLVDCMAEWPGGQIIGDDIRSVAQKLCDPFGITVLGLGGPRVGTASFPHLVLQIGQTPWELIETLARIAGLMVFDDPNGNLILAENPGTIRELQAREALGQTLPLAASGFAEGVNIKHARAALTMDQRFSHYKAFEFSYDSIKDVGAGESANLIATFQDPGVPRYRPQAVLMELGKTMAFDNLTKRAVWEAKRRWGRSHQVVLTTDSWRDSAGALYAPNMLAPLDAPMLKVSGVLRLMTEITYRRGVSGTECDITLMPPEAFDVAPTLPQYVVPVDVAREPPGLANR